MLISVIVAMTPRRLIGVAGRLPWHLPEDLKRFRQRTMGHAIVMGRKTFASLGRPLPGRRNLVVSRNPTPPAIVGVEWFGSLEDAIESARRAGETECFIAGGSTIYAVALAIADRMYITLVPDDASYEGDAYFPQWDQTLWTAVDRQRQGDLEFITYHRKGRNDPVPPVGAKNS